MIEQIIAYLNASLDLTNLFEESFVLTETIDDVPMLYCEDGEFKPVSNIDNYNGVSYWKKGGDVTQTEATSGNVACDKFLNIEVPLVLICAIPRKKLIDNAYTSDSIASIITTQIYENSSVLKSNINARKVSISVSSYNTNSQEVFNLEFKENMPLDYAFLSLSVKVNVEIKKDCIVNECDPSNEIILPELRINNYVTEVTAVLPITSTEGKTPVISTQMNTNKLIGRGSAGVGVMEEITLGTGLSLSGNTLNVSAGGGDVVGPASAVADDIATFDSVTGKLIKDSGKKISDLVLANVAITGATKTKITYDSKGLITSGADATTDDISEGITNLYWSNARTINSILTGLSVTGSTIVSTDTILEALGKAQNQINSLVGGVNYQGSWNASTNTPTLVSATGTKGYYYVVSVAGSTNLDGITDWKLGDWAIYNGTSWQKIDNTDAVISVNGYTGAVTLTTADISDTTNKRYVTDAHLVILGNTSGTNSGNETASTLGSTINGASSATPNDTDLVATVESSVVKKITWANVKAFLLTWLNSIRISLWGIEYYITTGDQTISGASSATPVNITGLVSDTLTISKRYQFIAFIPFSGGPAAGSKLAITFPTGSTMIAWYKGRSTGATAYVEVATTTSGGLTASAFATNVGSGVKIEGEVSLSTTAGVIQVQAASTTNGQTTVITQIGAKLMVKQIN